MRSIEYRPEIDGLRAIAVLAVIFFHSGINIIQGGFIGVDIFFIISGYLITNIIITSLENGQFSFIGFYIRRIKRLFPAVLFMTFVVLVLGWFFLTADKYVDLSKSAFCSNLFMANVWFWKNTGYFDASAKIRLLLHMWSLSIEEQFYLFFPMLMCFSYRIKHMKGVKFTLFAILIISLSINFLLFGEKFSFYNLPSRAWEFSIGGLLGIFQFPIKNKKYFLNIVSLVGVVGIAYGLITISKYDYYPGYLSLFPTVGTALIICSSYSQNNITKILSSKPLQFIGKISYSAYLWHWPLIVFYRIYINQRRFYIYETAFLVIISLFFGYLSWRFIENRYRYVQYSALKVGVAAICATVIVGSLATLICLYDGFPSRINEAVADITDEKKMWESWQCTEHIKLFPNSPESYCVIGKPWNGAVNKGVVWGDSHSLHFAQILHYEALRKSASLVIAPETCPPYIDSKYIHEEYPNNKEFTNVCTKKNRMMLEFLSKQPNVRVVILAAAWSAHVRKIKNPNKKSELCNIRIKAELCETAFETLLMRLKTKKVLIIGDVPRPNRILNECAASEFSTLLREECDDAVYKKLDTKKVKQWHQYSDKVLLSMAAKFDNVTTIIPIDFLCNEDYCRTYVNGELLYKDSNHLRRNFKQQTVVKISKKIGLQVKFEKLWKD